jgi:aminopeptidase
MDPRNTTLAKQLLTYSIGLKRGETVFIEIKGIEALALGKELIRLASEIGATPFWLYNDESLLRQFLKHADEAQFRKQAELQLDLMKKADAYIGVRGNDNSFDLSDIPSTQMDAYNALFYKPVHYEQRVKHTRWVVMRYPNNAMAQMAEQSQEAFADFYYSVCCLNYERMSLAQDGLKALMDATKQVRIVAPETDLTFSIENIPVVKCDGHCNIPDGECFTAPVRESINGTIKFNCPSLYNGILFSNIFLRFENGKIVESNCDGNALALEKVFNTDEGARYTGEFAIGVNPFILHPMKDILFDEKIAGSFHLTPGQCYEEASNGNQSAIHWDLVQIQRPDYGGGQIYFDGKLIRDNGVFTDSKLENSFSKESLK